MYTVEFVFILKGRKQRNRLTLSASWLLIYDGGWENKRILEQWVIVCMYGKFSVSNATVRNMGHGQSWLIVNEQVLFQGNWKCTLKTQKPFVATWGQCGLVSSIHSSWIESGKLICISAASVIMWVLRLVSPSSCGVALRLQYKHYNGGLLHLMDEDESFVVLGARRSPYI